jgi:hypothetical protein
VDHGRAAQVDPIKLTVKAPGSVLLKLRYDGSVSNFAFNFNLCRYTTEGHWRFQTGDDEAPGGFCDLLREKSTDPELAIREWKALKVGRCRLTLSNPRCQRPEPSA